jgi:hypothetical protein
MRWQYTYCDTLMLLTVNGYVALLLYLLVLGHPDTIVEEF